MMNHSMAIYQCTVCGKENTLYGGWSDDQLGEFRQDVCVRGLCGGFTPHKLIRFVDVESKTTSSKRKLQDARR